MLSHQSRNFFLVLCCVMGAGLCGADEAGRNWPSFRGPNASGTVGDAKAPEKWNIESGENVLWKTETPGMGLSSPIVWGDRVFITTAVGENDSLKVGLYGDIVPINESAPYSFRVLCLDRKTGKVLWDQECYKGVPKIKRHPKSSHANSTPATDGKHVVAFFGSEGLYCYDMDGKLLWKKDLGTLDSGYYMVPGAQWGFASSPLVDDGKVYVQCDAQKDSFIACFDADSGRQVWRTPREEVPTWSTPTVVREGGRAQLVANGFHSIAGYDLSSGKQLWKFSGGGDIPVPTPVTAGNIVFITNGHGADSPIYALKSSASGEFDAPAVNEKSEQFAWWLTRRGNYMQTPIVVGEEVCFCNDAGIFTVYKVADGAQVVRRRLTPGGVGFTASPVLADGKLYYTSEEGDVHVLKAAGEYPTLATNALGESSMATPAVTSDGVIFRTRKHLIAIGEKAGAQRAALTR